MPRDCDHHELSGEHGEDSTLSRAGEAAETAAAARRRRGAGGCAPRRRAGLEGGSRVMIPNRIGRHEESWLLLPWLANGRLSQRERVEVAEHLSECAECAEEVPRP